MSTSTGSWLGIILSWGFILSSQLFFFAAGWVFFMEKLFRDYEVRDYSVGILFSASFASCCALFEMTIFEILDILDQSSRLFHWKLTIYIVLFNVIILLPFYQFYHVFSESDHAWLRKRKWHFSLFLWLVYLYLFWKVGDQLPPGMKKSIFSIEAYIGRVGVIGVTLIAILSGLGAVLSPYNTLFLFIKDVTDQDIANAERKVNHNLNMILVKKKKLASMLMERKMMNKNPADGLGRFMRRVITNVTANFNFSNENINALSADIKALEVLNQQLFMNLDDLNMEKDKLVYATTWKGKYFNMMGYVFSAYCVWKIFSCTINILFNRTGGVDPVTHALHIAIHYLGLQVDAEFWSPHLSFVFVGVIVFSSIRGLLIQFMKVFRRFSNFLSPNNLVIFLAHVMGMYFLSTVLMMRTSVPPKYRTIITNILGDMEFSFYHRWFDYIFLVSSLSSIFVIWAVKKLKDDTNERADEISLNSV